MLPTQQVEWLIPEIQSIIIDNAELNISLLELEQELKNMKIHDHINRIKNKIKENEEREAQLREQGKQIMLDNGLKKFEMLDGTTIQLNSTPGALVVAEWVQLDPKYYKEKTTITMDKVQVKKDFMEWLILDPGVTIESEYKFIIKSK